MNLERLAQEYVNRKKLLENLTDEVGELKKRLAAAVEADGDTDERGHQWLVAGRYMLQRQRRQGKKVFNTARAEEWARETGAWEDVKVVREELSEDLLLGYVYERRKDDPVLEHVLESFYDEAPVTWAFQPPVEQKQYDY